MNSQDMILPGRMPVKIIRAYRSPEPNVGVLPPTPVPTLGTFGQHTTLKIFNDTLQLIGPQAMAYVSSFGQALLSRRSDGTYSTTGFNFLRGAVGKLNADDTRELRFKDGLTLLFDTNGRLIERKDRKGNAVTILRDPTGKITEIREPSGSALVFQYTGNRVSQITNPKGQAFQYQYNPQGQLTHATDPMGGTTIYTYDTAGRILTITNPRGFKSLTNTYNGDGRLIRQEHADGGIVTFNYQVNGTIVGEVTTTDPGGNVKSIRLNSRGYLSGLTDGVGRTVRQTRDFATGQLRKVRDPRNGTIEFTYDARGNTTSIKSHTGLVILTDYDPNFSLPTRIIDPKGNIREAIIDGNGNATEMTDPLGHKTIFKYDPFGQPTEVFDQLGNKIILRYDQHGNQTFARGRIGNVVQKQYDETSNLLTMTEPRGPTTKFEYDDLNRAIRIEDKNGISEFTYDANNNILSVKDHKGQANNFTYDSMDRLLTRTDPLNRQEVRDYDANGNIITLTDRKGQVTNFEYDVQNRLIASSYADGSTIQYAYDSRGRLIKVSDSISGTILFSYDILGRLVQNATSQGINSYEYDELGRRVKMTATGQLPVFYTYDKNSRLTQLQQGSQSVSINYDELGRRTSLSYSNGTSTFYSYSDSRLANILHQDPAGSIIDNIAYAYDNAGDKIGSIRTSGAATKLPLQIQANYDAANQQIQLDTPNPNRTYDANSNLETGTDQSGLTTTYTWDARNRLVGINRAGLIASFTYDGVGRRSTKTINGVKTVYHYDGWNIIAEFSNGSRTTYLRSLFLDEAFMRKTPNGEEFFHSDALGSTLALSDGGGAVQTQYSYEPFGNSSLPASSSNPFQYVGRENDGTGLYYYRARYYDPQARRFLQEDPIGFLGGDINLYAYVGNAPIQFRDPMGLAMACDDPVWLPDRIINETRELPPVTVDTWEFYWGEFTPDPPGPAFPNPGSLKPPYFPFPSPHVWWAQWRRVRYDTLHIYARYQRQLVVCRETLTDECGKTWEWSQSFIDEKLVELDWEIINRRYETFMRKLYQIF